MKFSQFNHLVAIPGTDDVALYNFRTEALMRLSPLARKLFEFACQLPEDRAEIQTWKANGFLVDDDEIESLKQELERDLLRYPQTTNKVLRLTIHVTSLCNFACPYCFQDRRSAHMAPAVQDAIVRYVENKLASGGYERMTVGWFGGEPLLAADIIERLGARLMEVAARHGAGFSSNIHTNGYLLTQDMVDLLECVNCKFALITLDGYGATHDQTRHLVDGGATFERIIENLYGIKTSMVLNVRSNLHAGNADTYDKLHALIDDIAETTGCELRCSPTRVHVSAAGAQRGDATKILDEATYERIKATTDLEKRMDTFAATRFACPAEQPDNYTIDDEGYLFMHCNEYATDQSKAYCNVLDLDATNYGLPDKKHAEFALRATLPTESEMCMKCSYLPTCFGGCLLGRLTKGADKRIRCSRKRSDADAFVLEKYEALSKVP